MTERQRLPNRRALETVAFEHGDQRFKVSLGSEVLGLLRPGVVTVGPVREVFISANKPESAIDCLACDGGILLSLLLQYGCPIDTIAHAMKRNPDGSPASPLGFAADLLREET